MAVGTFRKTATDYVWIRCDTDNAGREAVAVLERALQKPDRLAKALRLSMAETIIPAFRAAFIQGLPKAVNMQVVEENAGQFSKGMSSILRSSVRANPTAEGDTLDKIYQRMNEAQMSGNGQAVREAMDAYKKHREAYIKSLQRLQSGRMKASHPLASGKFRSRALRVLQLFVDQSFMKPQFQGDSLTVGIGPLDQLDAIKTPSATQFILKRGPTTSRYNILWRHLEMGTGFYSQKGGFERPTSKFNEGFTSGGWYYGKARDRARLVLHGSEGIGAIHIAIGKSHASFLDALENALSDVIRAK